MIPLVKLLRYTLTLSWSPYIVRAGGLRRVRGQQMGEHRQGPDAGNQTLLRLMMTWMRSKRGTFVGPSGEGNHDVKECAVKYKHKSRR